MTLQEILKAKGLSDDDVGSVVVDNLNLGVKSQNGRPYRSPLQDENPTSVLNYTDGATPSSLRFKTMHRPYYYPTSHLGFSENNRQELTANCFFTDRS